MKINIENATRLAMLKVTREQLDSVEELNASPAYYRNATTNGVIVCLEELRCLRDEEAEHDNDSTWRRVPAFLKDIVNENPNLDMVEVYR